MRTWLRRLGGVLLFPFAWWVYQTLCVRVTFACDRATSACTLVSEGPGGTGTTLPVPLGDVLGAAYEYSHVAVSAKAPEILAQARTLDDVHRSNLYEPIPGPRRQRSHRVVIYTRRAIVPLTPDFALDERREPEIHEFNWFIEGRKPGRRAEIVVDESLKAKISAGAPCLLGLVLIVLPKKREEAG